MSDYEQHSGKIRKIERIHPEESLAEIVKRICAEKNLEWKEEYLEEPEEFPGDQYEKYVLVNEDLYEIFEHKEEEEEDSFARLTPLPDGSYYFISRFYNGGTCLTEMLEDEIKTLKKKSHGLPGL